eukprot:6100481-Prymnesium_polylepis.1
MLGPLTVQRNTSSWRRGTDRTMCLVSGRACGYASVCKSAPRAAVFRSSVNVVETTVVPRSGAVPGASVASSLACTQTAGPHWVYTATGRRAVQDRLRASYTAQSFLHLSLGRRRKMRQGAVKATCAAHKPQVVRSDPRVG